MVEWKTLIALLGGLTLYAGVVAAVISALWNVASRYLLSRWIEKEKAELSREIETHKSRLRRMELLFDKELEAAGDFIRLHRQIRLKYRFEDMILDEAYDEVSGEFGSITKKLTDFLATHGAIVSEAVFKEIEGCIDEIDGKKFDPKEIQRHTAEQLLKWFPRIENLLINAVKK
jgi:hypothetical protein